MFKIRSPSSELDARNNEADVSQGRADRKK
jgi:hypothetical protein